MTLFWLALSKSVPINSLKVLTTAKGASNMLVNLLCKRKVWLETRHPMCLMKFTPIVTLQICLIGTLMAYFKSKPQVMVMDEILMFSNWLHQWNPLPIKYWPDTNVWLVLAGSKSLGTKSFVFLKFGDFNSGAAGHCVPTILHSRTLLHWCRQCERPSPMQGRRGIAQPPFASYVIIQRPTSHITRLFNIKTILAWFSKPMEG